MNRSIKAATILAGLVVLTANLGGCPPTVTSNPDALPEGEGLPNNNQFTVNGETKDTGLNFQTPADYQNDPVAPPPPDTPPPASVDLTSKLPPIGDQGQLGSCAAWACGYGLATWNVNGNNPAALLLPTGQAGPAFLYVRTMVAQGTTCDTGSQMDTVMNLLIKEGCSSMATVPYDPSVCPTDPSNADANTFKIGSFGNLRDPKDRALLKKSLAAGRPLAIGVETAANFNDYKTGVYVAAGGAAGGKHAGHAMVVVGYDDAQGAYRIMNSWNTTWGEAGFMWWEYADFERACGEAYEAFPVGSGSPRTKDGAPYGLTFAQQSDGNKGMYLIATLTLPRPVLIESITCTDPNGAKATTGYGGNWFGGGPLCFVHPDGDSWTSGTYTLTVRGQAANGEVAEFTSSAALAAAPAGNSAKGSSTGFGSTTLGATLDVVTMRQP